MKKIIVKEIDTIEGVTRKLTIKEKVSGYRKRCFDAGKLIYFRRGNIEFIIDKYDKNAIEFTKYNYANAEYEHITYEDVRKIVNLDLVEGFVSNTGEKCNVCMIQ